MYPILSANPHLFEALVGIGVAEFETLQQDFSRVWATSERERLSCPGRQRTLGGGRAYILGLREQVLMMLIWLQQPLNTAALGSLFGVSPSTASRNVRRMYAAFTKLRAVASNWPKPPKRGQGKTIQQLFQAYPELQAVLAERRQPSAKREDQEIQFGDRLTREGPTSFDPVQLISRMPLFKDLALSELETVSQAAQLRRIEQQRYLFHQGDPAITFYILVEGRVRLTEVTPEGQQILVRFISAGEAIGIIAALENTVYPLAAQALADCLVLTWESKVLEQLLARFPRIAINGLRLVSQRWHELEERYRELATERVEQRVAQTLLRLVRQVGRRVDGGVLIDLPLSRQDLAEMTGTTLYTVSRILSRWEQESLVESGRERILICYPHGLARIAEDLPPEDTP